MNPRYDLRKKNIYRRYIYIYYIDDIYIYIYISIMTERETNKNRGALENKFKIN